MTQRGESGEPSAPPGWYPDPAGDEDWRWYDGRQWTHVVWSGPPPHPFANKIFPVIPKSRPQWIAFAVSLLVGLIIWIPDAATHDIFPNGANDAYGGSWVFPLTLLAAVLLGAAFTRSWQVVAAGLMVPQFLLAPWTQPHGDNDGLWALIFFVLGVLFVLAHALAGVSAFVVERSRERRRTTVGS